MNNVNCDSWKWSCCRARFCRCRAGKRRDHDASGFGLPPGIDNRTSFLSNNLVIPHPCFGVDWFSDGSEQAERAEVVFCDPFVSCAYKGADSGRGGIENSDFVAVDDIPESVPLRVVGSAFVHEKCGAVEQRSVNHVAVSGNPAYIGGTPVDVLILDIKNVFE